MFCDKCGTYLSEGTEYCTNCGAPQGDAAVENELNGGVSGGASAAAAGMPMKWHNFLVKFALYLSVVGCAYNAIMALVNVTRYALGIGMFYNLCIIVIYVALAIMALKARGALAKFKKDGPKLLQKYFVWSLLPSVLGFIMPVFYGMPVRGVVSNMSTLIISILSTIVIIVLHNTYYKKRASLFVN